MAPVRSCHHTLVFLIALMGCRSGVVPTDGAATDGLDEDDCTQATWYLDRDGDSFGSDLDTLEDCEGAEGYVAQGGDCDDFDAEVHPDAEDPCDDIDQDCDGVVGSDAEEWWYPDADCDGYGDEALGEPACEPKEGGVSVGGDCDDSDPAVGPHVRGSCGAPEPWAPDRILVEPGSGLTLAEIAADLGTTVIEDLGRSGVGVLAVPEDREVAAFVAELAVLAEVGGVWPEGVLDGQSEDSQVWHLEVAGIDELAEEVRTSGALSDWTVAVLDTGVAYAEHEHDGVTYAVPEGLRQVDFVPGYDFVDDDDHPHDEHQHGTHITSLIAGQGAVPGGAPGVKVLPVRILDASNTGTEWSLIEGIHFAIEEGAQVINLSAAFRVGYVPSAALTEALDAAREAGVVVVAAAGNDGAGMLAWPAASPDVISVGAITIGDSGPHTYDVAPYSNRAPGLDFLAPGGDVLSDDDGDGFTDGVYAETISLRDPSVTVTVGLGGTSQATAMATAAAVHTLEAGFWPEEVSRALKKGAWENGVSISPDTWLDGLGAGVLNTTGLDTWGGKWNKDYAFSAVVLPWIRDNGDGTVSPAARVTLLESLRTKGSAKSMTVYGSFHGSTTERWSCEPDRYGDGCDIVGSPVAREDAEGAALPLAWGVSVEAVVSDDVSWAPRAALCASDALEILLAAAAAEPELHGSALAIAWPAGSSEELGDTVEALALVDTHSGLSTLPFGLVLTPEAMVEGSSEEEVEIDLDGTGFASSPMGKASVRQRSLSGAGFASSPMGFEALDLLVVDGLGGDNEALDLRAVDVYGVVSGAYDSDALDLDETCVQLSDLDGLGDLDGTSTGALYGSHGWLESPQRSAASVLAASMASTYEVETSPAGGAGTWDAECE